MGNRSSRRHYDAGAAARVRQQQQQLAAMRREQQRRQQEKARLEKQARELAEQNAEQERKRQEEKCKFERELKEKEAKIAQSKRDELARKIKLLENTRGKQAKIKTIVSELAQKKASQLAEIQAERQRLDKLNFKEVQDGYVFVLLGKTGVGKSTFTNRIYGDTSRRADKGPAKTSSSTVSCTTAPEIVKCNFRNKILHVVDSGGFADTEGRDSEHANNLCEFLNGCGGINAFVLLLNSQEPRMTAETINALLEYEKIFGTVMYKQLVVVVTRVDKGENLLDYKEDNTEKQLRNSIATKLKLHEKGLSQGEIATLPVIPIGRQHYKPALDQVSTQLQTRVQTKFGTTELRSPLNQLQSELNELMTKYKERQSALEDCAQAATNLSREVDGLRNALDTTVVQPSVK